MLECAHGFLNELDPRVKILLYIPFLLFAITYTDPIYLSIMFFCTLAFSRIAKVPLKVIKNDVIKPTLIILAGYLIINLFGYRSQFGSTMVMARIGGITLYYESLIYTWSVYAKFITVLSILRIILIITPIAEILDALTKWRFPPDFTIPITVGFSYYPVLAESVRGTLAAQQARGLSLKTRNPFKLLKAYFPVLIPAIYQAFRRSENIALVLETRGFSGDISRRTYLKEYRFRRGEYVFTLICVILSVFAIVTGVWFLNWGSYSLTKNLLQALLKFFSKF